MLQEKMSNKILSHYESRRNVKPALLSNHAFTAELSSLLTEEIAGFKYIDFANFCKVLGISKSQGYKISMSKKLPVYKPGGKKMLFLIDDVYHFIQKGRLASIEEIKEEVENFNNHKK